MRDTEYYLIFVEYVIFGDVYLLTGNFMKKNKQRSDRARSEVFRCIGRKCVCVCVLLNPVHYSLLTAHLLTISLLIVSVHSTLAVLAIDNDLPLIVIHITRKGLGRRMHILTNPSTPLELLISFHFIAIHAFSHNNACIA